MNNINKKLVQVSEDESTIVYKFLPVNICGDTVIQKVIENNYEGDIGVKIKREAENGDLQHRKRLKNDHNTGLNCGDRIFLSDFTESDDELEVDEDKKLKITCSKEKVFKITKSQLEKLIFRKVASYMQKESEKNIIANIRHRCDDLERQLDQLKKESVIFRQKIIDIKIDSEKRQTMIRNISLEGELIDEPKNYVTKATQTEGKYSERLTTNNTTLNSSIKMRHVGVQVQLLDQPKKYVYRSTQTEGEPGLKKIYTNIENIVKSSKKHVSQFTQTEKNHPDLITAGPTTNKSSNTKKTSANIGNGASIVSTTTLSIDAKKMAIPSLYKISNLHSSSSVAVSGVLSSAASPVPVTSSTAESVTTPIRKFDLISFNRKVDSSKASSDKKMIGKVSRTSDPASVTSSAVSNSIGHFGPVEAASSAVSVGDPQVIDLCDDSDEDLQADTCEFNAAVNGGRRSKYINSFNALPKSVETIRSPRKSVFKPFNIPKANTRPSLISVPSVFQNNNSYPSLKNSSIFLQTGNRRPDRPIPARRFPLPDRHIPVQNKIEPIQTRTLVLRAPVKEDANEAQSVPIKSPTIPVNSSPKIEYKTLKVSASATRSIVTQSISNLTVSPITSHSTTISTPSRWNSTATKASSPKPTGSGLFPHNSSASNKATGISLFKADRKKFFGSRN